MTNLEAERSEADGLHLLYKCLVTCSGRPVMFALSVRVRTTRLVDSCSLDMPVDHRFGLVVGTTGDNFLLKFENRPFSDS